MIPLRSMLALLALFLAAQSVSSPLTTLKKRDGSVLRGELPNYLVLKTLPEKLSGDGLNRNLVTYYFFLGTNAATLDENGVRQSKDRLQLDTAGVAWIAQVSYPAGPPADSEVLRKAGESLRAGNASYSRLGDGGFAFVAVTPPPGADPQPAKKSSRAPVTEMPEIAAAFFGPAEKPYAQYALDSAQRFYSQFMLTAGASSPQPFRWPGELLGELRPADRFTFFPTVTVRLSPDSPETVIPVAEIRFSSPRPSKAPVSSPSKSPAKSPR